MNNASAISVDFTAIAQCPKCGTVAVHWIDAPRRATQQEWDSYEEALADYDSCDDDVTRIERWGGVCIREIHTSPPPEPPIDEDFPVVRECRSCGRRWGNM